MTAGGETARFNAMQLQNLMLLIDREASAGTGGPWFAFEPRTYGPYDAAVFEAVDRLAAEGNAVIDGTGPYWVCYTSEDGFREGTSTLAEMSARARRYLSRAARWVLARQVGEMMAGIYRRYPEMAIRSRIPRSALRAPGWRYAHPFLAGMATIAGIFMGLGRPQDGAEADAAALEGDWRAVGDDLRCALDRANASD